MKLRHLLVFGSTLYCGLAHASIISGGATKVYTNNASINHNSDEKKYRFVIVSDNSDKNKTTLFGVHNLSDKESKRLVAMTSKPNKLGDIIEKRGAVGVYSSFNGAHNSFGVFSRSVGDIPQAVDTKTGNEYKFTPKGVSITKNANGRLCTYLIPYRSKNADEVIYDLGSEIPSCLKHDKSHPRRLMITRKEQKK